MVSILSFAVTGFILGLCVSQKVIAQGFATDWPMSLEHLSKYNDKNIQDICSENFPNVRLRSRADLYSAPYNTPDFSRFFASLSSAVDKCLEVGIALIVPWIHREAEAAATEDDRTN